MDRETAGKVRGMVRLARIRGVKDDGETQTASAEIGEGLWHDDIEVMQPYGFAAHVPEDGALALVLAVGGDEGHLVALPVGNPSSRMGNLPGGGVALYNAGGDRLVLMPGGALELTAGGSVTVKAPEVTVEADTVVIRAGSGTLE